MLNKISFIFIFLITILPITLITGPAIPDMTITFAGIFFLIYFIAKKETKIIFNNNLFIFSFIFWFFLLFISVFAENIFLAYRDSIIFIRFLIFPIVLYYLISTNEKIFKIIINIIFFTVIFVCVDSIYQFSNYNPETGFGKDIFGFTPDWYGRLTGPFYKDYKIEGNKVLVSFEKDSLFGGLMVGSKGLAKDRKEPGKFVEPALPTPKDKLNHFRLCGQDKKWHPAEARIVGDRVEVISPHVSIPIGVQYAYSAVPEQSNLYNRAGLPATPFALINKKLHSNVVKIG